MANKRLRKELLETARDLYDLGVMDATTMREFDALRHAPVKARKPRGTRRHRLRFG